MLVTTLSIPETQDLIKKSFIKGLKRDDDDIKKLFIARPMT